VQQYLSSVFPVSLQSNFPFFCFSQQHVFTSSPIKLQTIFGEAADAAAATVNAAMSGSHFVTDFINSPPSILQLLLSTPWIHVQGHCLFSGFSSKISRAQRFLCFLVVMSPTSWVC
jgi:hypothetical protein